METKIIPFLVSQKEVAKLDRITSPEFIIKKVPNTEYTMENYGYAWRFHPDGLFSENIFGCVLDYTCACPREWTTEEALKTRYCPNCGAKLTLAKARRVITAAIELPITIINPLIAIQAYKYLDLIDNKHFAILVYKDRQDREKHIAQELKVVTGPELTNHIKYDIPVKVVHPAIVWILLKYLLIDKPYTYLQTLSNLNYVNDDIIANKPFDNNTKHRTKDKDFIEVIIDKDIILSIPTYEWIKKQIPDYARSTTLFKEEYFSDYEMLQILIGLSKHIKQTYSKSQFDKLISYLQLPNDFAIYRYIEVLPPDFRPIIFDSKVYHVSTEYVNAELWPILRIRYAKTIEPIYPDLPFDYYDTYTELIVHIHRYFQILMDKISKKNQVIRGHKLGKRVDLSARAVLVGNPALKPDEVILPYLFGLMLYYPYILRRYAEYKQIDYSTADRDLQDMIERKEVSEDVQHILDQFLQDNKDSMLIIIMRQPVLHIPSLNVFKIHAWSTDIVIQMNQLVWEPYGGDADGDSVRSSVKLTVVDKQNATVKRITIDLL